MTSGTVDTTWLDIYKHSTYWHPSHAIAKRSPYPICEYCGVTVYQPRVFTVPCPKEPEQHRVARTLGADDEFVDSIVDDR